MSSFESELSSSAQKIDVFTIIEATLEEEMVKSESPKTNSKEQKLSSTQEKLSRKMASLAIQLPKLTTSISAESSKTPIVKKLFTDQQLSVAVPQGNMHK